MIKLREINQPPPEAEGSLEEQIEALREYLRKITEELTYLFSRQDNE